MRAVHWFRSDLRLRDNRALADAAGADQIVPLFVLDDRLLASQRTGAPRLRFLLGCLERLARDLRERDLSLVVRRGDPRKEVPRLCGEIGAERLCTNRDYGPYARRRDAAVTRSLEREGVEVRSFKDRVVFESGELRTQQGSAYRVYTPFQRAWWKGFRAEPQEPLRRCVLPGGVRGLEAGKLPDASGLGVADDATTRPSRPGARGAPASPSSTRACASCARSAGCTTARAWRWPASSPRTC